MRKLSRDIILSLQPGALDPPPNEKRLPGADHVCAARQTIPIGAMVTRNRRLNLQACKDCGKVVVDDQPQTLTQMVKSLPASELEGVVSISINVDGMSLGFPNQ